MSEVSPGANLEKNKISPDANVDQNAAFKEIASKGNTLYGSTAGAAENLLDEAQAAKAVEKDGLLTEEEQGEAPREDLVEASAMAETEEIIKEAQEVVKYSMEGTNPVFVLEMQKVLVERKRSKAFLKGSELEKKLDKLIEDFKEKKKKIEEDKEKKAAELREAHDKEVRKLKKETSRNIRKLAKKLRRNSEVKTFRKSTQALDSAGEYFDLRGPESEDEKVVARRKAVGEAIAVKRDEVKENPQVENLTAQIDLEKKALKAKIEERNSRFISGLTNLEAETRTKINNLKKEVKAEGDPLREQIVEKRDNLEDAERELDRLEMQVAEKREMQAYVNDMKDLLRNSDFSDKTTKLDDVEERAANTLSLSELNLDQGNIKTQLEIFTQKGTELEQSAMDKRDEVLEDIETSFNEKSAGLVTEQEELIEEENEIHAALIKELNEPLAEAIVAAQEAQNLHEGTGAIDLINSVSGLGAEAKKAEKKIEKSGRALDKAIAGIEKRFAKLQAKLTLSKEDADREVTERVSDVLVDVRSARVLAREVLEGDFSKVSGYEWVKKMFSKLFG